MIKQPKVIILLAGMGSRLGRPYPKGLTHLNNGETIFSRQIRIFRSLGLSCIAVIGFKKDLIMEADPDILYAYNANYDTTNTSKSLLCGLQHIHDEDVLWVNGDVVFEKKIIQRLLSLKESAVAVNNARVADEEVKYTIGATGYINAISKQVVNPVGEALGINLVSSKYLDLFKTKLEMVDEQDYFERAMEMLIQEKGDVFLPLDVGQLSCVEVDFQEDLVCARKMVAKEKSYNL